MPPYSDRRASAGLVSGFLTMAVFVLLLAAFTLGFGPTFGV